MEDGKNGRSNPPRVRKTMGPLSSIPDGQSHSKDSRPATPPPPPPDGRVSPSRRISSTPPPLPGNSPAEKDDWARKALDKIEALEAENRGLSTELDSMREEWEKARSDFAASWRENQGVEEILAEVRAELSTVKSEKATAAAALNVLRSDRDRAVARLEEELKVVAGLRGQLSALTTIYNQCQADLEEASKERSVFRVQLEKVEAHNATLIQTGDNLRGQVARCHDLLGEKENKFSGLETALAELTGRQNDLADILRCLEDSAKEFKDADFSAAVKDGREKVAALTKGAAELAARLKGGRIMADDDNKKTLIREKTPAAEENSETDLNKEVNLAAMKPAAVEEKPFFFWAAMLITAISAFALGVVVTVFSPAGRKTPAPVVESAPVAESISAAVEPAAPAKPEVDMGAVNEALRLKNGTTAPTGPATPPVTYTKVLDCAGIKDPAKIRDCVAFVNPCRVSDCAVGDDQPVLRRACLDFIYPKIMGSGR